VLFDRAATEHVSRLTVGFRFILAIPHLIVSYLLSLVANILGIVVWFAALFTARVPDGLHEFMTGITRYTTRVQAYSLLLTDEYPPFAFQERGYPVEVELGSGRLNRAAVFFRLPLLLPAAVVSWLILTGLSLLAFPLWLITLILGRVPRPLFDAVTVAIRYQTSYNAYLNLLTPAYPAGLFGPPSPQWDDVAANQAWAERGGPQPPEYSRGGKALTGVMLASGAVIAVVVIVLVSIFGPRLATFGDVRDAHDRVISALDQDCQEDLACFQAEAAEDASAFRVFDATINVTDIPARAEDEQAELSRVTNALIDAYAELSLARNGSEYNRLLDTLHLDTLLRSWDAHYDEFENAIL
jgi:hypothetical protein